MNLQRKETFNSIGLLILRLGVGGFMLTHGWSKVKMLTAGQFEQMGSVLGLSPEVGLVLITLAEFGAALLVILGLATRFAAPVLVIAMGVAAFVAHANDPWTMERGAALFMSGEAEFWSSKEPALLYLFPFLALTFTGAGAFSLDALLAGRLKMRKAEPAVGAPAVEQA